MLLLTPSSVPGNLEWYPLQCYHTFSHNGGTPGLWAGSKGTFNKGCRWVSWWVLWVLITDVYERCPSPPLIVKCWNTDHKSDPHAELGIYDRSSHFLISWCLFSSTLGTIFSEALRAWLCHFFSSVWLSNAPQRGSPTHLCTLEDSCFPLEALFFVSLILVFRQIATLWIRPKDVMCTLEIDTTEEEQEKGSELLERRGKGKTSLFSQQCGYLLD